MIITALHHVHLSIPRDGEPQARAFYGDLLGMTEVQKPPALAARGGAWFRSGTVEVHLGIEEPFRPAAKAHPGFLVADLDALTARLTAAGVDVVADALFPGFRRGYVRDPFGNRIELLEPGAE